MGGTARRLTAGACLTGVLVVAGALNTSACTACGEGAAASSAGSSADAEERAPWRSIRVACVGDSITTGFLATSPEHSYPSRLQDLLGPGYEVLNLGHSGAMLMRVEPLPDPYKMTYWATDEFKQSLTLHADIVVIMLGTNDATGDTWRQYNNSFASTYSELINLYRGMRRQVLLAVPPKLYKNLVYGGMLQEIINSEFPSLISAIAEEHALPPPISVSDAFGTHCPDTRPDAACRYMSDDGCHPSDEGYMLIARTVHAAITRLGPDCSGARRLQSALAAAAAGVAGATEPVLV